MEIILNPSNKKVKSVVYLTLMLFWTLIWFTDDVSERNLFEIKEIILWAMPTFILIYQSIYNKAIIWTIAFVIGTVYSLMCFVLISKELINEDRYFITDILLLITFILIPFILYIVKPTEFTLKSKTI